MLERFTSLQQTGSEEILATGIQTETKIVEAFKLFYCYNLYFSLLMLERFPHFMPGKMLSAAQEVRVNPSNGAPDSHKISTEDLIPPTPQKQK